MFAFSKNKKDNTLTAILPQHHGLSVACVKYDSSHQVVLNSAEFIPWDSEKSSDHLLQDKVKQFGMARRSCTTILEIGDYSILSVEAPDVPDTELRQAIRWQIKDLIDFHIDDAVLDVFDAPASGADGRQHNLYVVVSKLSTVQQRVTALQDVAVNLTTIDIPELVLRNISTQLPEDNNGVAFVYMSNNKGLLILTRESTLYLARVLDIGYETLQQASPQLDELSGEMINPTYERLILEIQRSLDYYDRYFVQPPISGIVFSPTANDMTALLEYVKNNLGVATRMLDVNDIVKCEVTLKPEQQAECLLAIGAAMRTEKKSL